MSGRWWRAYSRARHDPKLLRLTDKDFRWWFNLLCVASEREGKLPFVRDLAAEFRVSEHVIAVALERLRLAGLLEIEGEPGPDILYVPCKWNVLQYVSDSSSNRVRKFRKQQRNVSETPSESEAETDTETDKKELTLLGEREAFDLYNEACEGMPWPAAQRFNETRRSNLRRRLAECGGIDGWRTALAKARASPFVAKAGWFSLDWMLKPANFTKVMEGNYDAERNQANPERSLTAALAGLAG